MRNINDKAVSPVIGVVLMVAITVILAAAIGATVFNQGGTESAPQTNLNIKADNMNGIILEHLGGDPINTNETEIRVYEHNAGKTINMSESDFKAMDIILVGDTGKVSFNESGAVKSGDYITVRLIDKRSNTVFVEDEIRF